MNLTWDYDYDEPPRLPDGSISRIEDDVDAEKILMEMNGYKLDEIDPRTGRPRLLTGFSELKADGTTACGIWIYSGVTPEPGRNRARERRRSDNPLEPDWGFAWPDNRRVLFNRASADPEGRPWSERKKLIWWDAEKRLWVGLDRPDFEPSKPPDYRPAPGATGMAAIAGDDPFIMKPDGVAWLFAPSGTKDGPLPTHYEPLESPVGNLLYPEQTCTPGVRTFPGPLNRLVPHARDRVPGRGHHLPAYRALPERADEPVQLLAQRIAAGDVRRAEPGAGSRARHHPRRLGDGQVGARPDRGTRDGHAQNASAHRRRPH